MFQRVLQPLDYPTTPTGAVTSQSRPLAVLFALFGIAANVALVWLIISQMHRAAWAHHDLIKACHTRYALRSGLRPAQCGKLVDQMSKALEQAANGVAE
jgi:hypothetical protein